MYLIFLLLDTLTGLKLLNILTKLQLRETFEEFTVIRKIYCYYITFSLYNFLPLWEKL